MRLPRSPLLVGAAIVVAAAAAIAVLLVAVSPGGPAPVASPSASASSSPSFPPSASASPIASLSPAVTPSPIAVGTPVPCGTFDPACGRMPVNAAGVAFTPEIACGSLGQCSLDMDVVYPRAPGPWPVVVAIPGGPAAPGIRSYLTDFALLVAGQGAVVFVADYRESPEWGGGAPTTYRDIACAIRFARARASDYGGDGHRVTLVAHSLGPFFASTVALSGDQFEPAPGTCLADSG